jgi:hypothetical protein
MLGTTISTVTTDEFVFTTASQNPLLITDTGAIDLSLGTVNSSPGYAPAVYGETSATIVNLGSIESDAVFALSGGRGSAAGVGIKLQDGGSITNGSSIDTSALIAGNADGIVDAGAGIVNYGTITALLSATSATPSDLTGVLLIADDTVINGSAADTVALISGGNLGGINSFGDAYIKNYGTVTATGFGGIILEGGASSIVNGTSLDTAAVINGGTSGYGVALYHAKLINFGTIIGGSNAATLTHYGVYLQTDGYAVNHGTIIGFAGAKMGGASESGQTLINDGVIDGTGGIAVKLNDGTNLLVVESAAVFEGFVQGDTYGINVLELGSGGAAGTLLGVGSSFTNFGTISFASQASWTIQGDITGLASRETIAGFAKSDTIVLDGFEAVSDSYVAGTGLELINAASTTITLDIVGSFSTGDFSVVDPVGDTTISLSPNAPCFAAGTWILTPRGQVPVEQLKAGDLVISQEGEDRPILWIGKRGIDLSRHPHPAQAQPIRIVADALTNGVPCRDLVVSPDHALFFDGHLIPAKALVNEVSIYQLNRAAVIYYHIELAEHGIIFAENAPVETYLETGNRGAFENGGGAISLHPNFGQAMREAGSCAPFIESGPVFEEVRFKLAQRVKTGLASPMALRV